MTITLGIDNGATGSIGVLGLDEPLFIETPVKKSLLGKAERVIMRVDHHALRNFLLRVRCDSRWPDGLHAYIERPYTGKFVNAMLPGQRAFEATLIVLEQHGVAITVIDSKTWQKPLLGDAKGSEALKAASARLGAQLYPQFAALIRKHKDADGLLIAHHFHHEKTHQ